MEPERSDFPLATGEGRGGRVGWGLAGCIPVSTVMSVRISGGMAWLLLLPALILGVILLMFGVAARAPSASS